jgi:flavin reductase (DIM6/NTAB) family NADH-FMN oxidoreductase RutF
MPRFTGADLGEGGWSRLLTAVVVPRPIAWITTRSPAGVVNLAPFSYFSVVTDRPPTLAVSIAHREPAKDTLAHLRATGEAVVHLVPPELADQANASSAPFPTESSEATALGLALAPLPPVSVPRLVAADIALACRLDRIIPVGDPPAHLVLLTVVGAEISDRITGPDGLPAPDRVRTWARLGGSAWLDPEGWRLTHLARPSS